MIDWGDNMGYQIVYNPEDNHKYPTHIRKKRKVKMIPLILFASILVLGSRQIRGKLEQWLIPGDPQVTKAAFSLMMEDLRDGESFGDAVTAFCNEIIAGNENKTLSWT